MLRSAATHYGDKIFIDDNGLCLSFIDTLKQSRIIAAALMERGFNPGDRAAIWAPNMHQWILAALGIHYAGGIVVTLNTRYKGSEAATVLNGGQVSYLFSVGDFLGQSYPAMLASEDIPSLKQTIIIGEHTDSDNTDWIRWDDFLTSGQQAIDESGLEAIEARANAVTADDTSDLLFTSGTTGAPKGVKTCHGQNLQTFRYWTELLGLNDSDRYLVINPFFHSFGYKAGILACLIRGATLLPHQVFDTQQILKRIETEKISMMPGPPTLFQSILADPNYTQYDLSSLIKATTGAAVIPVELITRMREDLGIKTVITAYGLTESCGLATMCRQDDSDEIIATTSGRALPDVEVICADSTGKALPNGEPGEILVRGFNVMQGYFNNDEATVETIDSEGWLHTGDIGILDEQGNLSITDRVKDMFITGGFNCYPAEIENLLNSHPDITMCAVIGIPDERMGEIAMAWIVPAPNTELSEADIIKWSREKMANYKVPRKVRITDALPMNASGKVLKTELRQAVQ